MVSGGSLRIDLSMYACPGCMAPRASGYPWSSHVLEVRPHHIRPRDIQRDYRYLYTLSSRAHDQNASDEDAKEDWAHWDFSTRWVVSTIHKLLCEDLLLTLD